MTVARSKKRRLPWSCLPEARGTLRVVVSSRLASTTERLRANMRQRPHQVEKDRPLDHEELGVLGRAHGGAAGRAREQGQLAEHLAGAEVGDRLRLGCVDGLGEDLEHPALDDVEPVPLVALAKDDVAGAELQELALLEHRLQHVVGLVLEEVGMPEEVGIHHHAKRKGRLCYHPLRKALPPNRASWFHGLSKLMQRKLLSQYDRGMT